MNSRLDAFSKSPTSKLNALLNACWSNNSAENKFGISRLFAGHQHRCNVDGSPVTKLWLFTGSTIIFASFLIAACGGGGDGKGMPLLSSAPAPVQLGTYLDDRNVPAAVGNTAIDGFNWINYRRQQAGLAALTRNSFLDHAAQMHAEYQVHHGTISHEQIAGNIGFSGALLTDRIRASGYPFNPASFANGEVIFASSDSSGALIIEQLLTAIYHRFQILEPVFQEVGIGTANKAGKLHLLTADMATSTLQARLGQGQFVTYPVADQQNVPIDFFSDQELPDPIPDRNAVGYPISVHADLTSRVVVDRFTVRPRGGAMVAATLLSHATDTAVPLSAVALIPLDTLATRTAYDVQFIGSVGGVAVNYSWSFITQ